jgi:hypothetical protein
MRYKKELVVITISLTIISTISSLIYIENLNIAPQNDDSIDDPQDDDNPIEPPIYNFTLNDSQYYYNLINEVFHLTTSEVDFLNENKFIVLNRMGTDDILDAFRFYWKNDLPIFITTDTMLHTWHIIFDETLKRIEEELFFPLLNELSRELVSAALDNFNAGVIQAKTLTYFSVGLNITSSTSTYDLPIEIATATEKIYQAILDEISINNAITQFDTELTKRFIDDFSQYKPRGHYTETETLKKYFRLFKWFSRIPFFFDSYKGEVFLEETPSEMIKSVTEITWLLKTSSITWGENEVSGLEIWDIFKSFLDVLVGESKSITIHNIDNLCEGLIGDLWNPTDIDNTLLSLIQETILNDVTIPEPEIPFIIDAILPGPNISPKAFVFFGERFTLDGYTFQHVSHPYVNQRLLPTSLDFAAICLNSSRSIELLQDEIDLYPGLYNTIINLQEEIADSPEKDKQTIQWGWIESLKDISGIVPECDNLVNLPEFMNSSEWLDEKLTTIMGSYAQLRHDTILYTKQTITGYKSKMQIIIILIGINWL